MSSIMQLEALGQKDPWARLNKIELRPWVGHACSTYLGNLTKYGPANMVQVDCNPGTCIFRARVSGVTQQYIPTDIDGISSCTYTLNSLPEFTAWCSGSNLIDVLQCRISCLGAVT